MCKAGYTWGKSQTLMFKVANNESMNWHNWLSHLSEKQCPFKVFHRFFSINETVDFLIRFNIIVSLYVLLVLVAF